MPEYEAQNQKEGMKGNETILEFDENVNFHKIERKINFQDMESVNKKSAGKRNGNMNDSSQMSSAAPK